MDEAVTAIPLAPAVKGPARPLSGNMIEFPATTAATRFEPQAPPSAAAGIPFRGRPVHFGRRLCPEIRELIGAWLVCLAIAAACFGLLAVTAPERPGWADRPAALIAVECAIRLVAAEVTPADRYGRF